MKATMLYQETIQNPTTNHSLTILVWQRPNGKFVVKIQDFQPDMDRTGYCDTLEGARHYYATRVRDGLLLSGGYVRTSKKNLAKVA